MLYPTFRTFIHGPICNVFNSFVVSAYIPIDLGLFATALTNIPTLIPAATVLERAAGHFLARGKSILMMFIYNIQANHEAMAFLIIYNYE